VAQFKNTINTKVVRKLGSPLIIWELRETSFESHISKIPWSRPHPLLPLHSTLSLSPRYPIPIDL